MLLYSDDKTHDYECKSNWIECIQYIYQKWCLEKANESLFLKLAVNVWYTLTLDGQEIILTTNERNYLSAKLQDVYQYFTLNFKDNENCEWLFGYMMTVCTYLWMISGFDYNATEKMGNELINEACQKGNPIALLLYANDNLPKRKIVKYRNDVKKYVNEYFNEGEIVDSYFIEVLL